MQKLVRFDSENQEVEIDQLDNTMQNTKLKKMSEIQQQNAKDSKAVDEMQLRMGKIEQQSILLKNEREKLNEEIKRCKSKKPEECTKDLMILLELDNPQLYRAKMKGFTHNPFMMKDLQYRVQKLPDDVLRKRMKVKMIHKNSTADELKKKVEAMKNERIKRQQEREDSQHQEFRDKE